MIVSFVSPARLAIRWEGRQWKSSADFRDGKVWLSFHERFIGVFIALCFIPRTNHGARACPRILMMTRKVRYYIPVLSVKRDSDFKILLIWLCKTEYRVLWSVQWPSCKNDWYSRSSNDEVMEHRQRTDFAISQMEFSGFMPISS